MEKTTKEIINAFDGKLVGSKLMKNYVASVLLTMPEDIIEF